MIVAIIGAVLVGLACAYFLPRERAEIQLIERAAEPVSETSFAKGGYLQRGVPNCAGHCQDVGVMFLP